VSLCLGGEKTANRLNSYVRPFIAVFSDVPDFRHAKGKRHLLPTVLTLVTLALLNQQNTLGQIADWIHGLGWQTRQRLHLRHDRVPSYATIRRGSLGIAVMPPIYGGHEMR
jgi:hypothetical protein